MIHSKFAADIKQLLSEPFVFADDIIFRLKADKEVWRNFEAFPNSYKRIRIAHIEAARRQPEEFEKRLRKFIDKTAGNKKIKGFGAVDRYY